jgi:transposase-like protein
MSKRREYDPAIKAAAMAALLEGQAINKVAADFQLPEGTVKAWRHRMKGAATETKVATEKREEIGTLLIDYLHANLSTLRAQQIVFADAEWLKKQDAGELAVLHGVMTDKAIRLLEALGGAAPTPSE